MEPRRHRRRGGNQEGEKDTPTKRVGYVEMRWAEENKGVNQSTVASKTDTKRTSLRPGKRRRNVGLGKRKVPHRGKKG